jgi:hypothetical protein
MNHKSVLLAAGAAGLMIAAAFPAAAGVSKNGATLAASKTIDICVQPDGNWRYSGDVSVWNDGALATLGLAINDCIENKNGSGSGWTTDYCDPNLNTGASEIPGYTDEVHATVFHFQLTGAPLANNIRNNAKVTILNHSGQPAGVPFGPNPKATYSGSNPPPACPVDVAQCTYSQGYWKNHQDGWPAGTDPNNTFFISGYSWGAVASTPPGKSGYYILAVQYIAAELNAANGSPVPAGIQAALNDATTWFGANAPSACSTNGSCGLQKTWGATLEDYNLGGYPGSPGHCGDSDTPAPAIRN